MAVEFNNQRWWKVYGNDLDGSYGRFHGIGGLCAVVNEADEQPHAILNDVSGHIKGHVNFNNIALFGDDRFSFKEMQFSGYGPLPGYRQTPLEESFDLLDALGWQGRRIDPNGLYYNGTRSYSPTLRIFIAADPLGHSASLDLYSFCGGDPINFLDPDGRAIWIEGESSTGNEPGAHMSINVGDPEGYYQSYSFGLSGVSWEHGLEGQVYREPTSELGGEIHAFKETTSSQDAAFANFLKSTEGEADTYGPNNCRSFSNEMFDRAPGTETAPPIPATRDRTEGPETPVSHLRVSSAPTSGSSASSSDNTGISSSSSSSSTTTSNTSATTRDVSSSSTQSSSSTSHSNDPINGNNPKGS